ncbi:unnamed protein product [Heligmosomoides polygyrus]|uniref:BED-type domain-containing protein n=1 Tax=Heligmosomoides polygyrus TaxID=6339 RepID=A0A183FM45_HELPZ|nr:unnamed protein product [Heligmosomoides polygyrus]
MPTTELPRAYARRASPSSTKHRLKVRFQKTSSSRVYIQLIDARLQQVITFATSAFVPNTSANVPRSSVAVPNTSANVPRSSVAVPNTSANVPRSSVAVANTSAYAIPSLEQLLKHFKTEHAKALILCVYCKSIFGKADAMTENQWKRLKTHMYGELVYAKLAEMQD